MIRRSATLVSAALALTMFAAQAEAQSDKATMLRMEKQISELEKKVTELNKTVTALKKETASLSAKDRKLATDLRQWHQALESWRGQHFLVNLQ